MSWTMKMASKQDRYWIITGVGVFTGSLFPIMSPMTSLAMEKGPRLKHNMTMLRTHSEKNEVICESLVIEEVSYRSEMKLQVIELKH